MVAEESSLARDNEIKVTFRDHDEGVRLELELFCVSHHDVRRLGNQVQPENTFCVGHNKHIGRHLIKLSAQVPKLILYTRLIVGDGLFVLYVEFQQTAHELVTQLLVAV